AWAKARGTPVTVRLVKGAYWDYEIIHARQHGWPIPVFTQKVETDALYERCAARLLEAYPHIDAAFGSHNIRSLASALAAAEALGLPKNSLEVQALYGMADPLKESLAEAGWRVRAYMPFGELLPGMAYLVRRLLENTANDSFLRQSMLENASEEVLLAKPVSSPPLPPLVKGGKTTASPLETCGGKTDVLPPLKRGGRGGEDIHFTNEPDTAFLLEAE